MAPQAAADAEAAREAAAKAEEAAEKVHAQVHMHASCSMHTLCDIWSTVRRPAGQGDECEMAWPTGRRNERGMHGVDCRLLGCLPGMVGPLKGVGVEKGEVQSQDWC